MAKPSFPLHASPYITRPPFSLSLHHQSKQETKAIDSSKQANSASVQESVGYTAVVQGINPSVMDKVLAFSILSASPADIAPGSDATGGSWARLSWRGQGAQTAEAEQQQLGRKGKSQSQIPPQEETRRPRFAPEFDGIDCFETIVWR
ncbi:uncharacterized protein LOC124682781 [Lolium rigidum]|uniref:uncharacterized protein LOC124682781 n=1 Tax=Lolium rigidum TaxID=89674 RepID=UPI001F5C2234|nr:uncharacterized protein LOC124682781 [Lolium rigidum]